MYRSKHSKFKNTGILFELLTRQITADILSGKEKSKSKDILFKYFKENKELGKEWQLYSFLINEQFLDEMKAERAISMVLKAREKLNEKLLHQEKYNLIKEIKENYPIKDFLKSSIKNYKVYASIYKVFEDHIGRSNFNIKEISLAKNYLIESLVELKSVKKDKEDSLIEQYKSETEEVRMLTYKFLVENLNKKYSSFNTEQKDILRQYINSISNTNCISEFIIEEKQKIKNLITELNEKIDNPVIKIKLREVTNQINGMNLSKGVKDNHIMLLLLSHELIKEIKSII